MAFKNIFNKFRGEKGRQMTYAKMLNGSLPIFSQFGNDVYVSDIVNNCIRSKATEISKLQPKHIRTNGDTQKTVNSSINRLLKFGPNEIMTTKDFLEKCTWLHEKKYNCFIYPKYELKEVNGGTARCYTGFYPLDPTEVDFLEDPTGKIYIKFYFGDGDSYTFPYSDIIHWRKEFSDDPLLGGGLNGVSKDETILNVLKVNHSLTEGLDKAVKASLTVRGLLKINTMMDDEKQEEERQSFESKLTNSQSGILPIDIKSDYIPINVNPTLIDKNTLEFIEGKILKHYGTSIPIITGNFTDEEYQAYYEKILEPDIIGLGQAFSKTLFTDRELEHGNEVIFYGQKLLFTNTKNKIAVADILGNRGALTDNQLLELFGYPPFEGGDERHMSLNFINRNIADQYQLNKLKSEKGVSQNE
ncbi:portal protein [[Clostridium] sordellii]|uniref:phage portal protein n=1 Tax=Paraclostridium sordellii TaxID=1505 RepID=UPI0005E62C10|nr:phage portal protein [Paeniclostridium sordellii]CEN29822.1 portal protein [[Clostridium] sordellii] [Paeniclostridium sordellii]CEN30377.1 portal protein [[Clostridium] sordellii] [Paeniclostridium sordellii]